MSNLLQQDSLTIAELDSVASLCASLCLADATATSGNRLLDPIASALGAESAAYRLVDLQAVPRIRTLISVGAPASVSDSYLADFYRDDPTLHLLQQGQHAMAAANTGSRFQRYRRQFLLPNGLVHHVGSGCRIHNASRPGCSIFTARPRPLISTHWSTLVHGSSTPVCKGRH